MFATRGTRNVQVVVPNEREHITILSAISADGGTVPNMYVFKGARARKRYKEHLAQWASLALKKLSHHLILGLDSKVVEYGH